MGEESFALREAGNVHFKAGRYSEAEVGYAEALKLLARAAAAGDAGVLAEDEAKCRLNRCACLLRLQGYAAARNEAEAVIRLGGGASAKAHFRLGQAYEQLHEPKAALAAFSASIRLDPKAREPREALEGARARLKAHPRLELVLDDLRLVEERAIRALLQADVPRARQQMQLMLKDARAQARSASGLLAHALPPPPRLPLIPPRFAPCARRACIGAPTHPTVGAADSCQRATLTPLGASAGVGARTRRSALGVPRAARPRSRLRRGGRARGGERLHRRVPSRPWPSSGRRRRGRPAR